MLSGPHWEHQQQWPTGYCRNLDVHHQLYGYPSGCKMQGHPWLCAIVTTNEGPDRKPTVHLHPPVVYKPVNSSWKTGTITDLAPAGINAGDEIDYVFAISNTGNVDLYNVTISDFGPPSQEDHRYLESRRNQFYCYFGSIYHFTIWYRPERVYQFGNCNWYAGCWSKCKWWRYRWSGILQSPRYQTYQNGELIDINPASHNPGDYINYKFKVKMLEMLPSGSITLSDHKL